MEGLLSGLGAGVLELLHLGVLHEGGSALLSLAKGHPALHKPGHSDESKQKEKEALASRHIFLSS